MVEISKEADKKQKFDEYKYFQKAEEERIHSLFREELVTKIPYSLWDKLGQYQNGAIRLHTINVLVCLVQSKAFKKLKRAEQNILKWAALFHDITKRGAPDFIGKDHVHPFNSAMATLLVFKEMNILVLRNDEE